MNNNENFSQGLVGLAAVNAGFLNWSPDALGLPKGPSESGFAGDGLSQQVVGFATGIGQGFMLDPFSRGESGFGEGLSDDDKKWAAIFYSATADQEDQEENTEESGMTFGEKFKTFWSSVSPHGIIMRDIWAGKYCKSLGYMKADDKNAFKRCKAATKLNFVMAQKGKWKYPASPMGMEETISPEKLAADSAKELASMNPSQKDAVTKQVAGEDAQIAGQLNARGGDVTPAKSNMMMYAIIGFVVLAIIIAIIIMMRRKSATA